MNKLEERSQASLLIRSHPSVILLGPPLTGMLRGVEAILEQEGVDHTELYDACTGTYPDLQIYDGRSLTVEEARQIRQDATLRPSCWSRKYTIISYIDRPHYTVTPILLKLIEEPPDHFSILLTTLNKHGIPPTIFSRSLTTTVAPSTETEVRWWVDQEGLDQPDLRVRCAAGDLSTAEKLDPETVTSWRDTWQSVTTGGAIPASFPTIWTEKLPDADEATQVACWMLLVSLTALLAVKSSLWRDLSLVALNTRNQTQDGYSNKLELITAILKVYALAVTIHAREQT